MELTQENLDKLQAELTKAKELEANKEKALQEERAKRKQLRDKLESTKAISEEDLKQLEEFRSNQKKLEEKKLKEKWKYEELLAEKDTKIEELSKQFEEIVGYKEKYTSIMEEKISKKMEAFPEEKREFIWKLVEWKSFDERFDILDWLTKELWSTDFGWKPKTWWDAPEKTSEYEKAKAEWDLDAMLKYAPVINKQE